MVSAIDFRHRRENHTVEYFVLGFMVTFTVQPGYFMFKSLPLGFLIQRTMLRAFTVAPVDEAEICSCLSRRLLAIVLPARFKLPT